MPFQNCFETHKKKYFDYSSNQFKAKYLLTDDTFTLLLSSVKKIILNEIHHSSPRSDKSHSFVKAKKLLHNKNPFSLLCVLGLNLTLTTETRYK